MKFDIIDPNVGTPTNVLIIIANIINICYNIPQMVKTYKLRSTGDISGWFLILRIIGNSIWIDYAIEINSTLMLINTLTTILSSLFIGYFKFVEMKTKNQEEDKIPLQEINI